jgi:ubiquitin-protein ligase
MELSRVRSEVLDAQRTFSYVECHPAANGSVYVLVALQTSQRVYTVEITFPDMYPHVAPSVTIRRPELRAGAKHTYTGGRLCLFHPTYWNPGRHSLTFVIARTAKWLNKYEVWCETGVWPGAEVKH